MARGGDRTRKASRKPRSKTQRVTRTRSRDTDVLIIGSGIGGLFVALRVAEFARVVIVTKKQDYESNTNYAQGGIAVATAAEDSPGQHLRDTIRAGAGLCHREVVQTVVREGPDRVRDLIELGVRFSRSRGGLALGMEGGHTQRRIAHAGDFTGREIERALLDAVFSHPNIKILEDHLAVDLILESRLDRTGRSKTQSRTRRTADRIWGAYVYDRHSGRTEAYRARSTVLASGGSGKVYLYTSNPDIATGDGVAMAYRAGATVANLEFVQFHPTCLYHPDAKSFLISEAVRGEGAILQNMAGKRFMPGVDPRGELAPRDIVARAIDREMKRRGDKYVLLDLAPIGKARFRKRFPSIYRRCRALGYDPAVDLLPVVPAAHYQCGGVQTNLAGKTSLEQLFAIGEVAMTGLHGANRLASNSLLEAVVFANRAVPEIHKIVERADELPAVDRWRQEGTRRPVEVAALAHNWEAVRRIMWDRVGIVRSNERLSSAAKLLADIRAEIERDYKRYRLNADLVELRNLAQVADLVVQCARKRRESRGLHYSLDYPKRSARYARDTVLSLRNKSGKRQERRS